MFSLNRAAQTNFGMHGLTLEHLPPRATPQSLSVPVCSEETDVKADGLDRGPKRAARLGTWFAQQNTTPIYLTNATIEAIA